MFPTIITTLCHISSQWEDRVNTSSPKLVAVRQSSTWLAIVKTSVFQHGVIQSGLRLQTKTRLRKTDKQIARYWVVVLTIDRVDTLGFPK